MEILKGVIKKSLIIIIPAVLVSAFFKQQGFPLGILTGWLLGIINLRGLVRNVKGLIGAERAAAKILFLNISRLSAIFIAIFALIYFKIVNAFGLLIGFTVVFILILTEGLKAGKEQNDNH
ncbi:MAG: hypothetical protein HY756_00145 [Nitrospirae bacterium]|nr:hypothetical protein [Nitrospirota bacterium]